MKLTVALEYVNLNKSSYCYQRRPRSEDKRIFPLDTELEKALKEMSDYELTLGYSKATPYLRWKHDRVWNRKKVYRHMSELKLLQPRSIKRIWIKNRRLGLSQATESNRRWEADMTYVPTRMGNMYLFVIEDIHDKEIVGWHMDIRCGAQQAIEALKQALMKRFGRESAYGLELIVRVDRGCQFTEEAASVQASKKEVTAAESSWNFAGSRRLMTSRTSRALLVATSRKKFTGISTKIFLKPLRGGKTTWNGIIAAGRTAR